MKRRRPSWPAFGAFSLGVALSLGITWWLCLYWLLGFRLLHWLAGR